MRPLRHMPIRNKLQVIIMATTAMALAIACVAFTVNESVTFRRSLAESVSTTAAIIAENSASAVVFNDPDAATATLEVLRSQPNIMSACIYTQEGRPFATYQRKAAPGALPAMAGKAGTRFERGGLVHVVPVNSGGETVGTLRLESDLHGLTERFYGYACIAGAVLATSLLAAYVLSRRLQKVVSGPITSLVGTAEQVSRENNYSIRAAKKADGELGILVDAFNRMLGQIQEHDRALKSSVAELAQAKERLEIQIAERRRTEEEQVRLATAVEQAADAIIISARDSTITYVNPAFERISGYAREEVIGRNPRILQGGGHDRQFYRDMWATLLKGGVWSGRLSDRRKDGSRFEAETTIAPVRDNRGWVTHYVCTHRDITYERQMEEQVRHAQKMEAVGRLAGGVAHDFNNLLTVISGFARVIREALPPANALHHDAGEIQKAAERATALTRQLLAFSRKQMLQPRVLDLNVLIRNLEKMIRQLVGEAIEVRLQLAGDLGAVLADPGQFEQVILNIVLNARDAMPAGGCLTVTTQNVQLDRSVSVARNRRLSAGDYVIIAIADTGTGMNDNVKAHLFEPFFTTKEQGRGTGLGLATCHGIIEQSGGDIRVCSEPGYGTVVKIYLPRSRKAVAPDVHVHRTPELPRGTETVLAVEDEPALSGLISMILRNAGYRVLKAANGAEGLRVFSGDGGRDIDLVITDVVMPEMSGADMAVELCKLRPDLPILFLSGYTRDALQQNGVLDPSVAFLEKPFTADGLAGKVRELLDKRLAAPADRDPAWPLPPPPPGGDLEGPDPLATPSRPLPAPGESNGCGRDGAAVGSVRAE